MKVKHFMDKMYDTQNITEMKIFIKHKYELVSRCALTIESNDVEDFTFEQLDEIAFFNDYTIIDFYIGNGGYLEIEVKSKDNY